ncbi:muramoyltetrapeptide carboxypeptidase [Janthinobacterium agaricidamnosum]|uniref:Murein tetrapeptide carboxypeptidase n=1 Tax=Janthinobacterium agaricidamnosum NBRC 102515 = DSM 9628 TaxID=1349767 RepID=W0V6S7_9BURK|nr:muramoyltetrapeptide carboxypeptidase [Janthinobacterium agaricidamnosum]CDG82947.1 murein tetrapeptide carboxypeptidase [Janthinobacterium agaricidamnosum NBRC 102515 = DSM 9628]
MKTPQIGIAIAAPGGYALDPDALQRGIERLREQGCLVHNYYDPAQKFQRFGGTEAGRLAQLHAAAADPEVQVVMALRGSYGISRILPDIDFDAMAASGKLFVGYSDFTAFHMGLMARTGRGSFAGPMFCDDFIRDEPVDFTLQQLWDCLQGPSHTITARASGNPQVDLSGKLWGGNLAMLVHLLGTPYFPHIDGGILFVEDVNEHPYRVERMLLQLFHAGVIGRQQAVLLGDFSLYRLGEQDNGYDFDAMLAYLRQRLPVPLLTGLEFGHIKRRVTLPFGGQARLRSDADGFELSVTDYPTLPAG